MKCRWMAEKEDCRSASCCATLWARRLAAVSLKTRFLRVLSNPLLGFSSRFSFTHKKAPNGRLFYAWRRRSSLNRFRAFCKRHFSSSTHQIKDLHSLGSLTREPSCLQFLQHPLPQPKTRRASSDLCTQGGVRISFLLDARSPRGGQNTLFQTLVQP